MTKQDLKIVFFGTPEFAVSSLSRLVDGGFNVAAVVTMPDKPAGRGHKMLHSAVKQYAEAHGLPVMQPVKLKDPEFIEQLRSIGAQLFIVIAFRMLPEVVWTMPELGTFNLHASLLPRYRGAAPINRAVMNGDTRTGVTTFFLKHEIDTGDVIAQRAIEIGPDECVGSVHDRLMELGAGLTVETVESIIDGSLKITPQSEMLTAGEEPTPAPKIFKETCLIDWTRTAREIHNHVRGLSPYPAAWTTVDGAPDQQIKVMATRLTARPVEHATICGTVEMTPSGALEVATSDFWIELLEVQPAGKRRMGAAEYLRGLRTPITAFTQR